MAPAASLAVLEASGAVGRSLVPLVARSDRSRAAARQSARLSGRAWSHHRPVS